MKVMISSDGPHAHYYIRMGWLKVFQIMGYECKLWDIHSQNAYDAFDEFEPEIFIGQSYNLNESTYKCIKERPHLKVALRASDWGDMQKDVDTSKYNILVANKKEIELVEKLKKETDKPNFVYNHYHDNWISKTHNNWADVGVKVCSMLSAADVFEYLGGVVINELACDIGFVGGYWEYKSRNLDPYLLQFCYPVGDYKIKIFGNQGWPSACYLGWLADSEVKNLIASSTICPNVSEPHSQDFGYDIIERPFKILAAGGFCVSDYVQSMAEDVFFDDELVFAKDPEEFKEIVDHYIKYPDERLKYMKKGQRCVLSKHTYFHRVAKMLVELDLLEESQKCLDVYSNLMEMTQPTQSNRFATTGDERDSIQ